jgi:putative DNA methylase
VSTFLLSSKKGKEAWVEPVIVNGSYHFRVNVGTPKNPEAVSSGTKFGRGGYFYCLVSGRNTPIEGDYIKAEAAVGRLGNKLMAIVLQGASGRIYVSPTPDQEAVAQSAQPQWQPDVELIGKAADQLPSYGMPSYGDIFTPRQLCALNAFAELVPMVRTLVERDARAAGLPEEPTLLRNGGAGATAYAEAVATYLAIAVSRLADYGSCLATWRPKDSAMRSSLPKQAIQMTWDFAEGSPFGKSSSGFSECVEVVAKVLDVAFNVGAGSATQANAEKVPLGGGAPAVVSTDPPYYNNIGYADLSDFFYVWLRRTAKVAFPGLFATVAVPKSEELVATPLRHGSKDNAEKFFLAGMTRAMTRLAGEAHLAFPLTIYYAYKQSESERETGNVSTGWETFLEAVIRAGLSITGTLPMRTEGDNRQMGIGANALASSIVLVCRRRAADAPTATRREFVATLQQELPVALRHLQAGNIAPVDLAQAAIGPGMAVFTRYAQVLDAQGRALKVREALALINETLDTALAEQEGDFDADSRWALAWFEQYSFELGEFGVAEVLTKAKVTSIEGLVDAGIVESSRGKVRLLKPEELPDDWDPATDEHLTSWEMVHHLIRALGSGEDSAAELVVKLGAKAETARELAYRLYNLCERKKRAAEALSYNALVQSWPDLVSRAEVRGQVRFEQQPLGV